MKPAILQLQTSSGKLIKNQTSVERPWAAAVGGGPGAWGRGLGKSEIIPEINPTTCPTWQIHLVQSTCKSTTNSTTWQSWASCGCRGCKKKTLDLGSTLYPIQKAQTLERFYIRSRTSDSSISITLTDKYNSNCIHRHQ